MTPLILIVDDEPQIQMLIQAILEDKGYKTEICDCGEKALELMTDIEFNLVLLDLNLPGLNGIEVSEKIKENSPNTPIIFITGLSTAEAMSLESDCKDKDDMELMYKPIDTAKLYKNIETLINISLKKGEA
ncbi:MAG: response regulator [Lentisphaeraceae bacterium]|nr:response regulator [Lentisphaeraceae bacterium]